MKRNRTPEKYWAANEERLLSFIRQSNACEFEYEKPVTIAEFSDGQKVQATFDFGRINPGDKEAMLFTLERVFSEQPLTEKWIAELHMILATGRDDLSHQLQHPGQYRTVNYSSPAGIAPWTLVAGLMSNLMLDQDALSPWELHCRFEYTHPFEDLNGRIGRLLWLYKMLQQDEKWIPGKLPLLREMYSQAIYFYNHH